MLIQAYHGVTGAQHQTNFNNFFAQGYRMISVSVYGDPTNPLYAAVWVQRSSPAWVAVHGVDSAGYQSFFNTWTEKGFFPVLVSATGTIDNAIFAAVLEQGNPGVWSARHGMTASDFANANAAALPAGQIIRSFAIYGTGSDRRYAAVWHPNPIYVKWHVHPSDSGADYQTNFNAETQLPGYYLNAYRPAYVALSSDATYCAVFKDDFVGPWYARHGMTSAEYQSVFKQQLSQGFYPIVVQGGGTTSSPLYAALFAQRDIPASRQWSTAGAAVAALAPVDQVVQTFMQANGVRAAQVAIAKNGTMMLSRGYTWAEPGYRQTQPSDRFLLASCSKMFCEAAIQSLYATGSLQPPTLTVKPNAGEVPVVGDTVTGNSSGATAVVTAISGDTLTLAFVLGTFTTADTAATMSISGGTVAVTSYTPSTAVYPLLGFSHPADARSDSITVQQLLDHQGGYNDGTNPNLPATPDPTYNMRSSGIALGRVVTNKTDLAQYMYGQPLQYTPGTNSAYSNYGYLLLGAVVEQVTGMAYFDYLNQAVLQPADLTEIEVYSTLASGRNQNQAIAEDQRLGLNPLDLNSQLQVPAVYGGDGEINEVGDPNDGMSASAETIAQFIFNHAVWGNGGRAAGSARAGSTPGASSWGESRWDGVDWSYVVNTRDWPPTSFSTANTTVAGTQALTTAAFTLSVAKGGTSGFTGTGALVVSAANGGSPLVQYAGIDASTNSFIGCTAPAGAGSANNGAKVLQASTVVGTTALTQAPFTLNVSQNGTQGFAATGLLLVSNAASVVQVIQYTGLDAAANAFTGCAAVLAGAGSVPGGSLVTQGALYSSVDALLSSIALA